MLIDELDTTRGIDGWYLRDQALDHVHNYALVTGYGIVEFHNHQHGPPGFSAVDEDALAPTVVYCLDLLDGTPYGAAVWADGAVHAEWWRRNERGRVERGQFDTIDVLGDQLRVLNARPVAEERLARQVPLLGTRAQAAIATLRVAVVGVGGTGSQLAQGLAYLGFRNVLLMDDDLVEITNLNRMVTAGYADVGRPKTEVTRKRMRAIDPLGNVGRRRRAHGDRRAPGTRRRRPDHRLRRQRRPAQPAQPDRGARPGRPTSTSPPASTTRPSRSRSAAGWCSPRRTGRA